MKIRNKIYQIIAIVALLGTSYSCSDDFFTEQAGNKITPEQHYKSQNDLYNTIVGTYVPLQRAIPNLLLIDGLRSDLMDITSAADINMKEINDGIISVNNPYIDGSDYYKTIINVNEILKNTYKVWKAEPPQATQFYLPKYVNGSLVSMRAMCYFTLVRLFGQATYIDDNMASLPTERKILSKIDMIDTLINQLKPYVFNTTEYQEIQIWGPNTKSLIGELYLENAYLNDGKHNKYYDSAAYYLKLGMESFNNTGTYKVTSTYKNENWENIFYTDGNGVENIDIVPFDTKSGQLNNFSVWTWPSNYMVKPTQLLVDSFNAQIRAQDTLIGDQYRGKGFTFDTLPNSNIEFYISKYDLSIGFPYSTWIPISRAADVHLLLAEALINKTNPDTTTAMLLLNSGIQKANPKPLGYERWSNVGVRGRVSLASKTIPASIKNDPVAAKIAIEDLIMNERVLELAYEGKRWFDLVRVAKRRNDPNYLLDKVTAKFSDPNKVALVRSNLGTDMEKWYLPTK